MRGPTVDILYSISLNFGVTGLLIFNIAELCAE